MICKTCTAEILDDCHYCPLCGKPTPLSAEAAAGSLVAATPILKPTLRPSSPEPVAARASSAAVPSDRKAPSDAGQQGRLHNLLTQANLCRMRRQWNEAIDQCIAVLRADPASQTAHSLLGDIYRDRGRIDDAIQWYRMAIDISPNPADEATLRRLEQESARAARLSAKRNGVALPVSYDAPIVDGTASLMGMSPRRWLQGVTIASLIFIGIMVIALLKIGVRKSSPLPSARDSSGQLSQNQTDVPGLPPARLGGPRIGAEGGDGSRAGSASTGGTGFAPDRSAVSRTVMASPRTPSNPDMSAPDTDQLAMAPASVNAVRSPSTEQPNGPASANPSSPPAITALADGMRTGEIVTAPGSADATVTVFTGPPQSTADPAFREAAIRNAYRAARNAFSTVPTLVDATIRIRVDNGGTNGAVLMTVSLDRTTADSYDPESASLDVLQHGLHSLSWASG